MKSFQNAADFADSKFYSMMEWKDYYAIKSDMGNDKKSEWSNPQVGDGVTVRGYSDCQAHTVIKRTKSTIVIQRDSVTRLDKPEFVPGGFAGHCTNQREIRWECKPDANGSTVVFTRRKNGRWIRKGDSMKGKGLMMGRHEFYDYNF